VSRSTYAVGPAVEAALAGALAGVLDLLLIDQRAGLDGALLSAAPVVIGLSIGLVTFLGLPLVLLVRLLLRHRVVVGVLETVRERGPRRVEAVVIAAAALAATAVVWWFGFRVVAHVHRILHDATAAGLLASTLILGAAVIAAVITTSIAPPIARAIARRPFATTLTSGRVAVGLLVLAATGVALTVHLALRRLAPAWDPLPSYVRLSAPIAVVAFAVIGVGRRLGPARGGAVLVACASLVVVGVATVGGADRARAALMSDGAVSTTALRRLQSLADGDGDGFADAFGGSDCDDRNADVHPGAPELVGNGIDDNCLGGDVLAPAIARRLAPAPSGDPQAARRDIILITIDALRADHTTPYGYVRDTTPTLEALAERGTRFERAESSAPLTRRALPSLLYGRYASTLPYREVAGLAEVDDNELPTLASTLRDHGWTTHAFLSNHGLLGRPALAGFESAVTVSHEDVADHHDNADAVTDRAIAWIADQPADHPYFLWIHYIDPHYPYTPSYDDEIAFTDAQIGRLLAALDAHGRGAETIVAVTADHGEGFGEHGDRFHGRSLYEDQTHVPLVIAVPGGPREVVATPVSLVDVAPTLLDLVGVDAPAGMNGRSAAAAVRGVGPVPPHPVLAELLRDSQVGRTLVAVWLDPWKIVRDLEAWTTQVFDVARDPEERHELRGRARELEPALAEAVDRELAALPGDL
jgi:choline-sulfatase